MAPKHRMTHLPSVWNYLKANCLPQDSGADADFDFSGDGRQARDRGGTLKQ